MNCWMPQLQRIMTELYHPRNYLVQRMLLAVTKVIRGVMALDAAASHTCYQITLAMGM